MESSGMVAAAVALGVGVGYYLFREKEDVEKDRTAVIAAADNLADKYANKAAEENASAAADTASATGVATATTATVEVTAQPSSETAAVTEPAAEPKIAEESKIALIDKALEPEFTDAKNPAAQNSEPSATKPPDTGKVEDSANAQKDNAAPFNDLITAYGVGHPKPKREDAAGNTDSKTDGTSTATDTTGSKKKKTKRSKHSKKSKKSRRSKRSKRKHHKSKRSKREKHKKPHGEEEPKKE